MKDFALPSWHYILDGQTPVPEHDLLKWARWYQDMERHVGEDRLGKAWVSTVFLGINHGLDPLAPVLFETMVFDCGQLSEAMMRYTTWEEAEAGHKEMVEVVQVYLDRFRRYDALRLHDRYLRFPKPKRAPAWRPCSFL